jgi:hypothetical protein
MQEYDYGMWKTSCGKAYEIAEGEPIGNEMRCCCYSREAVGIGTLEGGRR